MANSVLHGLTKIIKLYDLSDLITNMYKSYLYM